MNAKGVDVSQHQGDKIDWQKFRDNGITFCFLRASVGLRADSTYSHNHRHAGEAGILRGAYHYLFSEADHKEQAQFFADTLLPGELPPVVDVEQVGLTEAKVRTFIDEFERITGQTLIIYTSQSKWHELVGRNTAWASDYDLWVANYRESGDPLLPDAWSAWTFWQHSQTGRVPGHHSHLDLNVFNGDEEALRAYAQVGGTAKVYDLLHYVCPPDGKQYRLFGLGDEHCQCVQANDGWIEFRKNRHMEEFYVTDEVIGRGADTSDISHDGVHPNGQFYVLYTRRPGGALTYGAPWAKRLMSPGDTYDRDVRVIRYNVDGSKVAEYDDATTLVFNAHYPHIRFDQSGITVEDVIELQWGGEEVYYYARNYGLVGWKNLRTGQGSYVGALSASVTAPFPHDVEPRPRVSMPAHSVSVPVVVSTFPEGTNPEEMTVNQAHGIWLLGMPGTDSRHIRVLKNDEVVTVYAEPVVPAGRYDWQRVVTRKGEEGWCAAVVDGTPSFVPVEEAPVEPVEPVQPPGFAKGTHPQRMQVNQSGGIWLLDAPGVESGHIRVLPYREVVTVFAEPVEPEGGYNWQRVSTGRGEQGWSAVEVDGVPSFVPLQTQVTSRFTLSYPVATPPTIAQPFGVNRTGISDFYTRWGLPAHEGVDFDGRLGDPIYAAAGGTVLTVARPGQGGVPLDHAYGKHIKIRHKAGDQVYQTDYCHLSSIAPGLRAGQPVTVGQRIGEMGNTGNVVANAVHLHFMLRKKGATAAEEKQTLGDGTKATYKNDIVDPTPYFG